METQSFTFLQEGRGGGGARGLPKAQAPYGFRWAGLNVKSILVIVYPTARLGRLCRQCQPGGGQHGAAMPWLLFADSCKSEPPEQTFSQEPDAIPMWMQTLVTLGTGH